jgi:hypothetical protein
MFSLVSNRGKSYIVLNVHFYMKELYKFSKGDLLKLLGVITMSDGSIASSRGYLTSIQLGTIAYNQCQHDLFRYLCEKVFDRKVKRFSYIHKNRKFTTSRLYGVEYIRKLLKLSPSFQTTSGPNKSKEEFLKSPQPNMNFILESNDIIKKLALRIYFDFDGSITPSFKLKNKKEEKKGKVYEYHQIQFECDLMIAETNPSVVKDLRQLCNKLGLNTILKKDKRKWSGIDGIRISGFESVKKFIKFGGPMTKVRISAKSYRLKGTTKKSVCDGTLRIMNEGIPLSYHFKDREKALVKKEELDKMLISEIKNKTS